MRNLKYYLLLNIFIVLIYNDLNSQNPNYGNYQEYNLHSKLNRNFTEKQWDSINGYQPHFDKRKQNSTKGILKKVVYGWYPYWSGSTYNDLDFNLLTDLAYFSYEVNSKTGGYNSIHSWETSQVVDKAKEAGVRVSLTVTLFSDHATFFASESSQKTLTDNLISLVQKRGAQGINIDFEAIPSNQKDAMTAFLKYICTRFHTELPGSMVTIAAPAVNWSGTFDLPAIAEYVDLFIIMGYEYYYSGSKNAGPGSPKNGGKLWGSYNITQSIRYYLQNSVPKNKLCLALPYYGRDWATTDSLVYSTTTATGTSVTYANAYTNSLKYGRKWNKDASVPYYVYKSGTTFHQCWYDDEVSLGYKYDLINTFDIAGTGIWALGYDGTRCELWNILKEKFTTVGNTKCEGSFTDMGGSEGDYYKNDSYSFTLSKKNQGIISATFQNFNLNQTDALYAYDGNSINSPELGKFSGSQNPGVISSTSNSLTFRFVSGSDTPKDGWVANWNCGAMISSSSIFLTNQNLKENINSGTLVSTINIEKKDNLVSNFSLYGNDNSDNNLFRIARDSIYSKAKFNYEKKKNYQITIKGQNAENKVAINSFDIFITDVNEAPMVMIPMQTQICTIGIAFKISIPTNMFFDEDNGDAISYSIVEKKSGLLPNWMTFNNITNELSGTHTGTQPEAIQLVINAKDKAGLEISSEFSISFEMPNKMSDYQLFESNIQIYPNPSKGLFFIKNLFSNDYKIDDKVELFDISGKLVKSIYINNKHNIEISEMPENVYFLVIKVNNKIFSKKIILIK